MHEPIHATIAVLSHYLEDLLSDGEYEVTEVDTDDTSHRYRVVTPSGNTVHVTVSE